jgi:outer membrane protein assembly factor BamB
MSPTRSFLPNARRRRPVVVASVVAAVVATAFAASSAFAQTSGGPEWPQFQGGPEHHGGTGDGPAPPYRTRWTFTSPDGSGLSGAVIVEGLAISVGRRSVYATDVATGDLAWDVPRADGPVSSPAIASGRPRTLLYVDGGGSTTPTPSPSPTPTDASPTPTDGSPSPAPDGDAEAAGASLVAIGLGDRREVWRAPLGAESRSGVTVDGEVAYVGDQDGTLYAVDVADGTVRWTSEMPGRIDVSIAASDGRVVAISRNDDDRRVVVAAHDADDGERLWQITPQLGATTASSATIADDAVIVGLADRFVRALDVANGQERWSSLALQLFSPLTAAAADEDAVFIADLGGGLYRFDATDGGRVWSFQFNEVVLRSSPVLVDRWVLLGLNDGRLVAVNAESGRLNWQSASSQGLAGTIAVSSEAIVVVRGGDDPGLVAFENDPDGRLIDEPSPTELDAGTTLGRVAVAAAIVLAATLVPGMLIRRRMGDRALVGADVVVEADEGEVES